MIGSQTIQILMKQLSDWLFFTYMISPVKGFVTDLQSTVPKLKSHELFAVSLHAI